MYYDGSACTHFKEAGREAKQYAVEGGSSKTNKKVLQPPEKIKSVSALSVCYNYFTILPRCQTALSDRELRPLCNHPLLSFLSLLSLSSTATTITTTVCNGLQLTCTGLKTASCWPYSNLNYRREIDISLQSNYRYRQDRT